jgi:hypothetical protein
VIFLHHENNIRLWCGNTNKNDRNIWLAAVLTKKCGRSQNLLRQKLLVLLLRNRRIEISLFERLEQIIQDTRALIGSLRQPLASSTHHFFALFSHVIGAGFVAAVQCAQHASARGRLGGVARSLSGCFVLLFFLALLRFEFKSFFLFFVVVTLFVLFNGGLRSMQVNLSRVMEFPKKEILTLKFSAKALIC